MLSIIIPTYNRAHLIDKTLSSIQQQTYTNWECIIVDDGSTDNSDEVIGKFVAADNRFRYFKRPESYTKGANSCRNFGFEQSQGEFINWFDSDDLMDKERCELKVGHLSDNKNAHCVISQLQFFQTIDGKKIWSKPRIIESSDVVRDYLSGKISIGATNPIWRREVLEKQSRLFDPKITQSQDLEFHSRIFKEYSHIEIIRKPLFYVRKGGSSISSRLERGEPDAVNSYIEVRRRVLELGYGEQVTQGVIRQLMYIFRLALGKKDYVICDQCLSLVKQQLVNYPLKVQLKIFRIDMVYQLVRTIGFGETKLRRWLHF